MPWFIRCCLLWNHLWYYHVLFHDQPRCGFIMLQKRWKHCNYWFLDSSVIRRSSAQQWKCDVWCGRQQQGSRVLPGGCIAGVNCFFSFAGGSRLQGWGIPLPSCSMTSISRRWCVTSASDVNGALISVTSGQTLCIPAETWRTVRIPWHMRRGEYHYAYTNECANFETLLMHIHRNVCWVALSYYTRLLRCWGGMKMARSSSTMFFARRIWRKTMAAVSMGSAAPSSTTEQPC